MALATLHRMRLALTHRGTAIASFAVLVGALAAACSADSSGDSRGGTADGGIGGTSGLPPPTEVRGGTCPPSFVNTGSGPGIRCTEEPGDTCADADHHCECGERTIEGSAWYCVPTEAGCPADMPDELSACDDAELICDYQRSGRHRCKCVDDEWRCRNIQFPCAGTGPPEGGSCEGFDGESCDYLRQNWERGGVDTVHCICNEDTLWQCRTE